MRRWIKKKEGNIKKEQPLPSNGERYGKDGGSARRWIEREIERETVGDSGGRWGTVGDSGEGWETVGKKGGSERE